VSVAHLGKTDRGGADYSSTVPEMSRNEAGTRMRPQRWGTSIIIGGAEAAGTGVSTSPFRSINGGGGKAQLSGGQGDGRCTRIVEGDRESKIEIEPMITHKLPLERIKRDRP